jgi:hypothetical protein
MGLTVSHGCWDAPYSKFMRFRRAIAAAIGVPLDIMEGFYDRPETVADALAWAAPRDGGPACGHYHGPTLHRWVETLQCGLPLSWSVLKPDPLHVLLHHSDCDGGIEPSDAVAIATRLREIAPAIVGEDFATRAAVFADGLEMAGVAGEPVTFR